MKMKMVEITLLKYNIPDKDGDIFLPGSVVLKKEGIVITMKNGDPIGKLCELKTEGDLLKATIELINEIPADHVFTICGSCRENEIKMNGSRFIKRFELVALMVIPKKLAVLSVA